MDEYCHFFSKSGTFCLKVGRQDKSGQSGIMVKAVVHLTCACVCVCICGCMHGMENEVIMVSLKV